ncbi:PepSY domain-containing protein [Metabacillus sp. RGM 3146]|uniref:PepSY domain-containing protein n=1 Tax=Metabacillus sp. RGM 3146 TaxID=3401092 RepID=UPI003B9D2CBE
MNLFKKTAAMMIFASLILFYPYVADAASSNKITQEQKNETNITMEEAQAIALKEVPGKVTKVVLKIKDNKPAVYKFVIIAKGKKHKVKIDAKTGAVLKVKKKNSAEIKK